MSDNDDQGFDDFFDPYDGLEDIDTAAPLPMLEDAGIPVASPPRSPLLTGLIIGLLLVVLSIAFFQLLGNDGDPEATPTTTTSTSEGETTSTTTDGSTTSSTPPESTTAAPGFDPYESRGASIPISELDLAVDAIGPIELGSRARQAIGRLVSSLGEPDEDTGPITSTGEYGGCEGETVRIVRWGALAAIVVIDADGTETFGGYRVDLNYDGALSSDTTELETLSGLKVGASVREIDIIYESFDRRLVVDPELGDIFELRSRNTGNLLLYGPVSSPESDGIITGIYAPDACGRFQ